MTTRYEPPFRGRPTTTQSTSRDGTPKLLTIIREYDGAGKKASVEFKGNILGGWIMAALYLGSIHGDMASVGLCCAAGYAASMAIFCRVLKTTVKIEITPAYLAVRGMVRTRKYDRQLCEGFELWTHDRVNEEAQAKNWQVRLGEQQGKVLQIPTYYDETWMLALRYAGQRIDLAEIFDIRKARAALDRLQECFARMDVHEGKAASGGRTPEADWKKQTPQPGAFNA